MVSDNKIFSCFPYIGLCKTCDPWEGHFWPQGNNLNKLGRGSLDDTSYQISRHCGFRQEDFFQVSHFIRLCKTCDPGAEPLLAPWA